MNCKIPRPNASRRMFCFPWVGGTSAWFTGLTEDITDDLEGWLTHLLSMFLNVIQYDLIKQCNRHTDIFQMHVSLPHNSYLDGFRYVKIGVIACILV